MADWGKRVAGQVVLCLLWGAASLFGLYRAAMYSNTPGPAANQPATWPADSPVPLAPDRPTLLVTLHPRCSCSVATLTELQQVLSKAAIPPSVHILLYSPKNHEATWQHSQTTRLARSLPNTLVQNDSDGQHAAKFRMPTSGHVAAYSPDGVLRFSGGVTPARGHTGPNAGLAAVASILSTQAPAVRQTGVFGCSVFEL